MYTASPVDVQAILGTDVLCQARFGIWEFGNPIGRSRKSWKGVNIYLLLLYHNILCIHRYHNPLIHTLYIYIYIYINISVHI